MKNLLTIILLWASLPLTAATSDAAGEVTLPLDEYQRLLEAAKVEPTEVPSRYAIGESNSISGSYNAIPGSRRPSEPKCR